MSRRIEQSTAKKVKRQLKPTNPHAAGIDIGATSHFVAVPQGTDPQGKEVREFEAFTCGLHELAAWLKVCKVTSVAMESTGVYWIPLYELLEAKGFEVKLVDASRVRNVPGRKSDVLDCQWIQQLHAYGLLSAAFRPEEQICVMRAYLRQRGLLVESMAQHIQHMQKALTQMNLKLQHVVSDLSGVTGQKIIRAMLAGERDPKKLSELRDERCKNSKETIAKALEGTYRPEHLFALRQAMELYDVYQRKLAECDQQIEAHLESFTDKSAGAELPRSAKRPRGNAPEFDLRSALYRMTGVDLTAINGLDAYTAAKVISEIGTDMSRWPTARHFASWLGLCPGSRISGGKRLSSKTKPCANKAATALRMAAQTLYRSKSALGALLRCMKSKLGPAPAITATAHKLSRIIYAMLKTGKPFTEEDDNEYTRRRTQRTIRNLSRTAKTLGYQLVPVL
jgi:transposase